VLEREELVAVDGRLHVERAQPLLVCGRVQDDEDARCSRPNVARMLARLADAVGRVHGRAPGEQRAGVLRFLLSAATVPAARTAGCGWSERGRPASS